MKKHPHPEQSRAARTVADNRAHVAPLRRGGLDVSSHGRHQARRRVRGVHVRAGLSRLSR